MYLQEKIYRDILLDGIRHCQKEKCLFLHAWCIMSNHIHLIASTVINNLSDVLRGYKKFTTREIIKAIENNQQESRRAEESGCLKFSGQGLLSQIIIDKYMDHLPVHRQRQRLERAGVKLSYSALTDW
jgi:putative transposase